VTAKVELSLIPMLRPRLLSLCLIVVVASLSDAHVREPPPLHLCSERSCRYSILVQCGTTELVIPSSRDQHLPATNAALPGASLRSPPVGVRDSSEFRGYYVTSDATTFIVPTPILSEYSEIQWRIEYRSMTVIGNEDASIVYHTPLIAWSTLPVSTRGSREATFTFVSTLTLTETPSPITTVQFIVSLISPVKALGLFLILFHC
jgi:hypothetical protein